MHVQGSMMLRGREKSLMKSSSSIDHGNNVDLLNLGPPPFEKVPQ